MINKIPLNFGEIRMSKLFSLLFSIFLWTSRKGMNNL